MQRLHVDHGRGGFRLRLGPKYTGSPVKKLATPLRDLVGVDVELLRQVGSVFSPLIAANATFALKAGLWFQRTRLVIPLLFTEIMPRTGRTSTHTECSDFPSHLCHPHAGACGNACALQKPIVRFRVSNENWESNMFIEDLFSDHCKTTPAGVVMHMLSAEVDASGPGSEAFSKFGNGLKVGQELAGLKADLARMESGWRPSAAELAAAPAFLNWGILDAGEPLLRVWGDVDDVSKVGAAILKGHRVISLPILARDKELTWIRDRRGFYRLEDGEFV